jgi:nucleotide sugar dehydrogenase
MTLAPETIRLGLVGNGFVGGAARQLACDGVEVCVYDKDTSKCVPLGTSLADVAACDLVFVAVPTPMRRDGTCHTAIVESVVCDLFKENPLCPIVIRSTCPPGTAKRLGVSFMPEFLTEARSKADFRENALWILGTTKATPDTLPETLQRILSFAKKAGTIKHSEMRLVSATEAELVKYARNTFLSVKVSYFNELYNVCKSFGAGFERVRELCTLDERIGSSHSKVPGPDGKFGFGGHCFPKDCAAWCTWSEANPHFSLVSTAQHRNSYMDRPTRDWEADKGRAVV